jgi:hypothetical protein
MYLNNILTIFLYIKIIQNTNAAQITVIWFYKNIFFFHSKNTKTQNNINEI